MDLALTLDYELFGNGSGNLFEHVIEPTDQILRICNEHGVKLTIFFEVVEYWRFKEEWNRGNKMNYSRNPVEAMENQIKEAYSIGHDIQLHIHPQWLNAKYIDQKWHVDNNWCMKNIPLKNNDQFNINLRDTLSKGKETLEKILKPIDPTYRCNIFRAGGFNILPSERIFPILKDLHFVADSSVFAGGFEVNELSNIKFNDIKNNIPYWTVKDNNVLNQEENFDQNILVELPIFSYPIQRFFKYDLNRIKMLFKNKKSSLTTIQIRTGNKTKLGKIRYFLEKEFLTWDYCLFNKSKTKLFLKEANKINEKSGFKYHPFVLIGHSKGFHYKNTFKYLLNKKYINFITLTDMVGKIKSIL